jgi:hypothetical protein
LNSGRIAVFKITCSASQALLLRTSGGAIPGDGDPSELDPLLVRFRPSQKPIVTRRSVQSLEKDSTTRPGNLRLYRLIRIADV